jgi:carboxylesterase type B
MIYVATNYRLGGFGFLAGPDVDANAGLLDQRLALEWVQKYIHIFGGSAKNVTVMGESAGAGSILCQLLAHGGVNSSSLFSQAIMQSPAVDTVVPQNIYNDFLAVLNVTTIQQARELSSADIIAKNAIFLESQDYNVSPFGPVEDGSFLQDSPIRALAKGVLDKGVNIIASHTSFEGSFFFDPNVKTEDEFKQWILRSLPAITNDTAVYLAEQLYPAVYDGSLGYVDMDSRQMSLWGEAVIDCTFVLLQDSLEGDGYACKSHMSTYILP